MVCCECKVCQALDAVGSKVGARLFRKPATAFDSNNSIRLYEYIITLLRMSQCTPDLYSCRILGQSRVACRAHVAIIVVTRIAYRNVFIPCWLCTRLERLLIIWDDGIARAAGDTTT